MRRLVFTPPASYTPTPHIFNAPSQPHAPQPMVIHVAQDDQFVVCVTESGVRMGDAFGVRKRTGGLSVQEFCDSVLDFCAREGGGGDDVDSAKVKEFVEKTATLLRM